MRFGFFFELSVPRAPGAGLEQQVYDNALEQAVLADALGFDWVWAVEHHFLEVYSHCSAPGGRGTDSSKKMPNRISRP